MDCVADMQVVFGWDIDKDGDIDTYSDADGATVSGTGSTTASAGRDFGSRRTS